MKIGKEFLLYENNKKYFKDYQSAYYNSKHSSDKSIYYVFTPTEQRAKTVGCIEAIASEYFAHLGCSYIDLKNKQLVKQLKIGDFSNEFKQ